MSGNIYQTVVVIITTSLIFGIFPVYVAKNRRKNAVKTSTFCTIVSFAYLTLFITMIYTGNLGYNPMTESAAYSFNTLAKLLILVVTLTGNFCTVFILIQNFYFKKDFAYFFNTIAKIDKTLEKIGFIFNHKRDFYLYLILNFSGTLFAASNFLMQLWNMKRKTENIEHIPGALLFVHLYSFALIHQGESLFVICNIILKKRFQAVNNILKMLNCKRDKFIEKERKGKFKAQEKILDACIICHDKLCDLLDIINKIFGFLIISGCLVQFNTVVYAFCYCYYSASIRPISTLGWFFWAVFRIYELTRKAVSAHKNTNEARATMHWVNKLLIHADHETEEKLQIFALQIGHRHTSITALGMFPIDGSFAFTVIGASTTYITIIYQFQVNKLGC